VRPMARGTGRRRGRPHPSRPGPAPRYCGNGRRVGRPWRGARRPGRWARRDQRPPWRPGQRGRTWAAPRARHEDPMLRARGPSRARPEAMEGEALPTILTRRRFRFQAVPPGSIPPGPSAA
jgi:hypothetical protein